jgi:hypothetical protein
MDAKANAPQTELFPARLCMVKIRSGSYRSLQGTYLLRQRPRVRNQRPTPSNGKVTAVIPAGIGLKKGGEQCGKAQRLGEVVGQNQTVGCTQPGQDGKR